MKSITAFSHNNILRLAISTCLLLAIPLVAMQFSEDVHWTIMDFIVAGGLLFGSGLAFILATRNVHDIRRRMAIGIAIFTLLFIVWVQLAVGIID